MESKCEKATAEPGSFGAVSPPHGAVGRVGCQGQARREVEPGKRLSVPDAPIQQLGVGVLRDGDDFNLKRTA